MTTIEKICAAFSQLSVLTNEPMAKHTSFHIGGPATILMPSNCEELIDVYRYCVELGERPLVLGAGTNILAPDLGLERIVICTKGLTSITQLADNILQAECGALLSRFACYARDLSLSGLEFAHGIPGTVGGGVFMNAGAYGGEMAQIVERTTVLMPNGEVKDYMGEDHDFSYRHSAFEKNGAIVLKAVVRLVPGVKLAITERMQELAQKRRNSQPLDLPSAGSTFKRPKDGFAAALIDQAGLKGKGVGDAIVSEKHAGFVVNKGNASAADVLATMKYIQESVYSLSGIKLEPEVRIW